MTTPKILIPLLNKSFSTFPGPQWYFDGGIYVASISPEDFHALKSSGRYEYGHLIETRTKCLYVAASTTASLDLEDFVARTATKLKYVLNVFSAADPPVVSHGVLIDKAVSKVIDLDTAADLGRLRSGVYKINRKHKAAEVAEFYSRVDEACRKYYPLYITLERFNSSLVRTDFKDRIIDITIALETLIPVTTELRYRFSLYHAFMSAQAPQLRHNNFKLLQSLYDARSSIVHGDYVSRLKTLQTVEQNWSAVLILAKASILYYTLFLSEREHSEWASHLTNLVFGIDESLFSIK